MIIAVVHLIKHTAHGASYLLNNAGALRPYVKAGESLIEGVKHAREGALKDGATSVAEASAMIALGIAKHIVKG